MKYFNTLPRITQTDNNGNLILVNNILTRAYLLPQLSNNINLFYKYDIKDGDTVDNLAYRYYNEVDRYWLVMYANNIMDPIADWPLNSNELYSVIVDRYKSAAANALSISVSTITNDQIIAYTMSTVHHYEQTIYTHDSSGDMGKNITVQIDKNTYDSLVEYTRSSTFNNGIVATKSVSKKAISIYDYEVDTNESKRNIKLIKDSYANQAEYQLKNLMSK